MRSSRFFYLIRRYGESLTKYEKGRDGRAHIKEELFTVTAEIKALQQQKALLTCLQ